MKLLIFLYSVHYNNLYLLYKLILNLINDLKLNHKFQLENLELDKDSQINNLIKKSTYFTDEEKKDIFYWNSLAADQNYPEAIWVLGLCYQKGIGCNHPNEQEHITAVLKKS